MGTKGGLGKRCFIELSRDRADYCSKGKTILTTDVCVEYTSARFRAGNVKGEFPIAVMRNEEQEIWDQVFLLNLFGCSEEPLDNLKIQKIVFISEDEARKIKLAAAHFPFFRYNLGPYSKVLANDVRKLEDFGFIDPETKHPTERGEYILAYVKECTSTSKQATTVLEILKGVCTEYRYTRSSDLVDIVYNRSVSVVGLNGEVMKVRDIPPCIDILFPVEERLAEPIRFPKELVSDLQTEFSLSAEDLDPNNPVNIKLAREAMSRALSA